MTERTRTAYLVSADHLVWSCKDLVVVVTDDGAFGFYANASGYGCSKNCKTAEDAIRTLFEDHACTNIRIAQVAGDEALAAQIRIRALLDKIDGLDSELDSVLDVLWRRGDDEARTWIGLNYPKFAASRTAGKDSERREDV